MMSSLDSPQPNDHSSQRMTSGVRGPDPTKMVNQAALQTSSGTAWIVTGTLFLILSLGLFGVLGFDSERASRWVALSAGAVAIALYVAMIVVRFTLASGPRRLRAMAICMLSLAAVSLIGAWLCAFVEGAELAATA